MDDLSYENYKDIMPVSVIHQGLLKNSSYRDKKLGVSCFCEYKLSLMSKGKGLGCFFLVKRVCMGGGKKRCSFEIH